MSTRTWVAFYILAALALALLVLPYCEAATEEGQRESTSFADESTSNETGMKPLGRALIYPVRFVIDQISYVLSTLYSLVVLVLEPLFVIFRLIWFALFATPWSLVKRVTMAIYPVYVFCA